MFFFVFFLHGVYVKALFYPQDIYIYVSKEEEEKNLACSFSTASYFTVFSCGKKKTLADFWERTVSSVQDVYFFFFLRPVVHIRVGCPGRAEMQHGSGGGGLSFFPLLLVFFFFGQ